MSIEERVAAIEKKLGIETPEKNWGLFWDDGEDDATIGVNTGVNNDGSYEINDCCNWDHFLPLTKEEIARFKAAGVPFVYGE